MADLAVAGKESYGSTKNYFNNTFYYCMHSACSAGIDAGGKVSGAGSYQRRGRNLLGQEQRTFHGRAVG